MPRQIVESQECLVLFDGVCGLCHRLVQFLIKVDRRDRLRFAPLQGPTAESILRRHGEYTGDLDTVYVVLNAQSPEEQLLSRSRAVLHAVVSLGGAWRTCAIASWLPTCLLDAAYDVVGRRRYQIFGRFDTCPVPTPLQRGKFLP
jgi:predicted DCC family thiol-disulfide oxidoreductase YuxK